MEYEKEVNHDNWRVSASYLSYTKEDLEGQGYHMSNSFFSEKPMSLEYC